MQEMEEYLYRGTGRDPAPPGGTMASAVAVCIKRLVTQVADKFWCESTGNNKTCFHFSHLPYPTTFWNFQKAISRTDIQDHMLEMEIAITQVRYTLPDGSHPVRSLTTNKEAGDRKSGVKYPEAFYRSQGFPIWEGDNVRWHALEVHTISQDSTFPAVHIWRRGGLEYHQACETAPLAKLHHLFARFAVVPFILRNAIRLLDATVLQHRTPVVFSSRAQPAIPLDEKAEKDQRFPSHAARPSPFTDTLGRPGIHVPLILHHPDGNYVWHRLKASNLPANVE
ncbi:hypothetical protein MKZ38_010039 [Zalerion maritima]|uniref:Uncharacterized protein n=1 Tax=Zalerion maritima TaxID=339359 RepID=A0AAD5RSX5_9PEZI|nr:hypothetical protein MKZ38_010039 [Zalerion maritima]